ncbi:MFS transporter [Candidatus Bathyarchaeota archaeon]|nr:MFS transporter [Candidatus Bathyarchaeota archaeon]
MTETKKEIGIGILRGNLFWLVICQCIWQFTVNIPRPYLPLYIKLLGGTSADIGLTNSMATLAGLFLYPLGGFIADKTGRVKIVGIATIFYAFSFIPFAFAQNWQTLAAASFFQQLVLFYAPILTVLQADSMPAGMRSQGFAIAMSIPAALGIISPYVGGYLVDTLGIGRAMNITYLVGFGAGLLVAVLRWVKLTETLDVSNIEKINFRNIPKLLIDSYKSFFETIKWMPTAIRDLAILQMLKVFFVGIAGSFWIVYATDIIGLSAYWWGLTSAISGTARLLFSYPVGRVLDRVGRSKLIKPALLITPFMPLYFLQIVDHYQLIFLVILMAGVNAFLMPGFQSLLADYTPRERRGRVTSAVGGGQFYVDIRGGQLGGGMLLFIPQAIAQFISGQLYSTNPTYPFYAMSLGLLITTIWAWIKVKDPEKLFV